MAVTAFMPRNTLATMPQLNRSCMNSVLYLRAWRQRNRVTVGPHPHAPQAIDGWKADLSQVERLSGKRQQVRLLVQHRGTHCLCAPAQDALPVYG